MIRPFPGVLLPRFGLICIRRAAKGLSAFGGPI